MPIDNMPKPKTLAGKLKIMAWNVHDLKRKGILSDPEFSSLLQGQDIIILTETRIINETILIRQDTYLTHCLACSAIMPYALNAPKTRHSLTN